MALIEKVCLYYREGVSDKVYEIHLTEEDGGFLVTGYNGRRGTKLVAQSKTPKPVPYRTARYIFDNLEANKLNHRQTPYRVASRERFDVAVSPAAQVPLHNQRHRLMRKANHWRAHTAQRILKH